MRGRKTLLYRLFGERWQNTPEILLVLQKVKGKNKKYLKFLAFSKRMWEVRINDLTNSK